MKFRYPKYDFDRSIAYALSTRAWSIASSFITLGMITHFLSSSEQGYYYTFSALLGAQVLFELGMGIVITQFASHSMAKLEWQVDGHISGDIDEIYRLSSLVKLTLRWYAFIAISIVVVLGPLGWYFISESEPNGSVRWQATWFCLVIATGISIYVQPIMSLLEGCQCVLQVTRIRLIQSIFGSFVTWMTLLLGGGLLALATWVAATTAIAVIMLFSEKRIFLTQMMGLNSAKDASISWRHEIWPFQWRIALSWISGYFIFQLFVPVVFAAQGADEAGRLGLSLAIASSLMGLSLAWFNTKAPQFGQLIARRNYLELDSLWRNTTFTTLLIFGSGGAMIVIITFLLQYTNAAIGNRLIDGHLMALLLVTTALNYLMIAQASYLRAHRHEPFLWNSLAYGAFVFVSTLVVAKTYGIAGVLISYFVCSFVFGTVWGSFIFVRKRREYNKRQIFSHFS